MNELQQELVIAGFFAGFEKRAQQSKPFTPYETLPAGEGGFWSSEGWGSAILNPFQQGGVNAPSIQTNKPESWRTTLSRLNPFQEAGESLGSAYHETSEALGAAKDIFTSLKDIAPVVKNIASQVKDLNLGGTGGGGTGTQGQGILQQLFGKDIQNMMGSVKQEILPYILAMSVGPPLLNTALRYIMPGNQQSTSPPYGIQQQYYQPNRTMQLRERYGRPWQ